MNKCIEFLFFDDEGVENEVQLPAHWVICSRCDGDGKHTNPSIDGHGITSEEWAHDWTDEEREGYLGGAYDVVCAECHGRGSRLEVDEEEAKRADPTALRLYMARLKEEEAYNRMCEMERRMGE